MKKTVYPNTLSKRRNKRRFFLFLGIGLLLLASGAFGLLRLFNTPIGQIRTGKEFVSAHMETWVSSQSLRGMRGRGRIRQPRRPFFEHKVLIPDAWYLVLSDEKDKTYKVEITQQQYNANSLENKVWSNYNAFKKKFKELYGKDPDVGSVDDDGLFILVIIFSIILSISCFMLHVESLMNE